MKDDADYKVVKDLSTYYTETISNYLDFIDQLEYSILAEPDKILHINLALHKIFKKIFAKLKKNKLNSHIKYQLKLHRILNKLIPVKKERRRDKSSGKIYVATIKTQEYSTYKMNIEKREIHIYDCLEAIGMISKEVRKTTRLR